MVSPKETKPEIVLSSRAGKFKATIFKNQRTTKTGTEFDAFSTQLQKSWLKANGDAKNKDDWENQSMSLFNAQEVRQAILVLQEAERKLLVSE